MGHADTLRRIADMIDTGRADDEVLAMLLWLAKAMVIEDKARRIGK